MIASLRAKTQSIANQVMMQKTQKQIRKRYRIIIWHIKCKTGMRFELRLITKSAYDLVKIKRKIEKGGWNLKTIITFLCWNSCLLVCVCPYVSASCRSGGIWSVSFLALVVYLYWKFYIVNKKKKEKKKRKWGAGDASK